MSVPNGERLATKQDLADMYQEILPYLGGMPEMVANKFSKGDMYSTDEKMIGQWIDGKPLYSKTVNFGTLPNKSTKEVAHNISDIDVMVAVEGIAFPNDHSTFYPLPYVSPDSLGDNILLIANKTLIRIMTGYNRANLTNSYVTVYYTKTTDSAISIGSDTDYSTEEKIVGTWIDGSPLYQKTIEITDISDWTPISLGLSNVDMIRKAGDCYAVLSNGAIMSEHSFYASSSTKSYFTVMLQKTTNNQPNVYITKSSSTSFVKVVLTIQYTKTT